MDYSQSALTTGSEWDAEHEATTEAEATTLQLRPHEESYSYDDDDEGEADAPCSTQGQQQRAGSASLESADSLASLFDTPLSPRPSFQSPQGLGPEVRQQASRLCAWCFWRLLCFSPRCPRLHSAHRSRLLNTPPPSPPPHHHTPQDLEFLQQRALDSCTQLKGLGQGGYGLVDLVQVRRRRSRSGRPRPGWGEGRAGLSRWMACAPTGAAAPPAASMCCVALGWPSSSPYCAT